MKKSISFIFILNLLIICHLSQVAKNELIKTNQIDFLKMNIIELMFEELIRIDDHQFENELSIDCFNQLNDFKIGLTNNTNSIWTFMYDSTDGKITGLLDGTYLNLGNFKQCLNIVNGKYFLLSLVPANLTINQNDGLKYEEFKESSTNIEKRFKFLFKYPDFINVKMGLCLPNQCQDHEIEQLLNRTVNRYNWIIQKEINSQISESIWSKLESSRDAVRNCFFILTTILSIIIISTCLDFCLRIQKEKNIFHSFIEATSMRSTIKKLHNNEMNGHKDNLISMNRYYSEILVNISHFIVFVPLLGTSVISERIYDWLNLGNKPYLQFLFTDAYYPGLIILASTTASLKMFSLIQQKSTGSELFENALKRMISFWPILIVLIAIQIVLPIIVPQGPLIKEFIETQALKCEKYWILNLLFINNIIPLHQTCLPYTWTISSEMQLYLIASLLTYIYIKNSIRGIQFNVLLILIGLLANSFVIWFGLTKPNVVLFPFNYNSMKDSIYYSHSNTFVQLSPYFTVYLAFYLRLGAKKTFKMTIEKEIKITIGLLIYLISTFHSSLIFNVFGFKSTNPILNTIYYMYNRSSMTIFVSWLILQYFPNGERSKRNEIKTWIRNKFSRKELKPIDDQPVSSSESTSDLSDHNDIESTDHNEIKFKKSNSIIIWIKLSKSIYYSHFFYLTYSLFNVNSAQPNDLISMMISIHSKIFWIYILAYPFHLIEGPITNLTNKLIENLLRKHKKEKLH